MSQEESRVAIEHLSPKIDNYAELLIRRGVALRQGQELVLSAPVERADFVRRVVGKAYEAGAGHVTVIWSDDVVSRLTYQNVGREYFEHVPSWQREQLDSLAGAGAAFLFLEGSDPSALDGIDPAKPAAAHKAQNTECRVFREGMDFGRNVWCIAGVPVEAWAREVFPEFSPHEAVYRLWLAILGVARSDGRDPQSSWETHNATFEKNKRLLNAAAYDRLRYRSSNGTAFEVGMNEGHVWEGGSARTVDGTVFFPNIPTEEIFTTPDRNRADGVVYSAMPLVHAGQVIDDFWIRFEAGVAVEWDARRGKAVLDQILAADEGARHLGEVALISKNTPIRQSGTLFYDTLYDENASCHLALGMGFPECLVGGLDMDRDELLAHGVNQSTTHVDFMVGADDLDVWGVDAAGKETPIFVGGQWAWEAE